VKRISSAILIVVTVFLLAMSLLGIMATTVHAQAGAPFIKLSPNSGFSAVTISGTGFSVWGGITIYWNGAPIPAIINTDGDSSFTAIISVPDQTSPGAHIITAVDEYKDEARATFRVIDMTGDTGPPGIPVTGLSGEDGVNCWDLNANGTADKAEDVNGDGNVDIMDCRGPQGEQGLPGDSTVIEGAEGPPGPAGPPGEPGEDGLSIVWKGEWDEDEEYAVYNAVSYGGSTYIAIDESAEANPAESADKWDLMVLMGEAGEPGEQGEAGGGGSVGTTGFFLGLVALILIAGSMIKKWTIG